MKKSRFYKKRYIYLYCFFIKKEWKKETIIIKKATKKKTIERDI
jgi:hypothetical protein